MKAITHDFKIGDFLNDLGAIVRVTEKAICVSINNGKWVGNKNNNKWIPKSALIIHEAKEGKGLINDESKSLLIFSVQKWFKI